MQRFNNNYLELSKENVLRKSCSHIDHALFKSPSWYGFTKFLNYKFLKQPSCPRNIGTEHSKSYLTWQLSWKFTYTLRTTILLNMCKKFYWMCYSFISAYANLPIPLVIFKSTSQFSFKFCISLQCHQK